MCYTSKNFLNSFNVGILQDDKIEQNKGQVPLEKGWETFAI